MRKMKKQLSEYMYLYRSILMVNAYQILTWMLYILNNQLKNKQNQQMYPWTDRQTTEQTNKEMSEQSLNKLGSNYDLMTCGWQTKEQSNE